MRDNNATTESRGEKMEVVLFHFDNLHYTPSSLPDWVAGPNGRKLVLVDRRPSPPPIVEPHPYHPGKTTTRQPLLWDGRARTEILVDHGLLPVAVVLLPSEGGKPEGILLLGGTSHRNRKPNTWQTELAFIKPCFVWATMVGRHHPSDGGGRGSYRCLALCQGSTFAHRDTRRSSWSAETARLKNGAVDVTVNRHVEPIGWAPALVGLKDPTMVKGDLVGRKTRLPLQKPTPQGLPAEELAHVLLTSKMVRSVSYFVPGRRGCAEGKFGRAQSLAAWRPPPPNEEVAGVVVENDGSGTIIPVPVERQEWREFDGSCAMRLAAIALSELPQGTLRDELLAWARGIQKAEARVAPLCEHSELQVLRQVDPRLHDIWRSSPENVLVSPPTEREKVDLTKVDLTTLFGGATSKI